MHSVCAVVDLRIIAEATWLGFARLDCSRGMIGIAVQLVETIDENFKWAILAARPDSNHRHACAVYGSCKGHGLAGGRAIIGAPLGHALADFFFSTILIEIGR